MGEKGTAGAAEGKGPWSWREAIERQRERGAHRGSPKANTSPKPLTGKTRWVDESFDNNQQSSETGVSEVCAVAGVESGRHSSSPMEKEGAQPGS